MRRSVFTDASEAVAAARGAFVRYSRLSLNNRKEIIMGLRNALYLLAETLAEMTVAETGMGNAADKTIKNRLATTETAGVEDLTTEVYTGDHGMTLFELSAYGVVCAAQPKTNPCATLINNTIAALAAGNAIIHCPHLRAVTVSAYLTEKINEVVSAICGIENLVVMVDSLQKEVTWEVMNHPDVDLVVCTGSAHSLRQAVHCGKKFIAAGPANPVAMVDDTANINKAAEDIVAGASFDYNLMCTSEKNVVIMDVVTNQFIGELQRCGAFYTADEADINKLTHLVITGDGLMNKRWEGKSASELLNAAGIPCKTVPKVIFAEVPVTHSFVALELMMPLVPLVRVAIFEEMLAAGLMIERHCRHTATFHSQNVERLGRVAKELQTAVFVKNGSSFNGIGFDGEGTASFTIGTLTGEGPVSARHFAKRRRCVLTDGFSIR